MPKTYSKTKILCGFVLCGLFFVFASLNILSAQPKYVDVPQERQSMEPLLVKEYQLNGIGTINVFTVTGNIELASAPGTQKVRIELYADRGFSFWPFSNSLDNYRITSLKRGNEISTSVELKSKHKSNFWGNETSFSYKITVPEYICTNLKTLAGNISLQDVRGRQLLKSTAGNIQVSDVQGMVKALASGGDIDIINNKGTIFAWVNGGDISIDNAEGELRLKIQGGQITSTDISGSMVAEVNAGDIDVQFKHVNKGINLTTNSGNINLLLPGPAGYELYARGRRVRFDEPNAFVGTYSTSLLDGSINGGGIPINLTANAGTVSLELKK